MPTSTSSTPQSRQAIEEGLQEHDQEQLKADGDGRTGVSPGVSGKSALAAAPESCLRAPSPLPLSSSGDDLAVFSDVTWNEKVLEPVLKTPS